MTLVAAYQIAGVPVLMGDFLLTYADGKEAGLKKKVYLVTDNIVIGWTGDLAGAEVVVTDFYEHFKTNPPTESSLESFIADYKRDLGDVTLTIVGWVVDPTPRCFRWELRHPPELSWQPYCYVGSGEAIFTALAGRGIPFDASTSNPVDKLALYYAGQLTADEVDMNWSRRLRFGFAYEILYHDGQAFKYLDDVVYAFARVDFGRGGRITGQELFQTLYKYHILGDFALIQIGPRILRDGAFKEETERHLIGPVYSVSNRVIQNVIECLRSPRYPVSYEGEYTCLFISLVDNAGTNEAIRLPPLVVSAARSDKKKIAFVAWENTDPENPLKGSVWVQMPPPELLEIVYKDATKKIDGK